MKRLLQYLKKPTVYISCIVLVLCIIVLTVDTSHRKHPRDKLVKEIVTFDESQDRYEVHLDAQTIATVNEIVSQPFFFLGKGQQVAAFESLDGQYVIKFILHKKLKVAKYVTDISADVFEKAFHTEKYQKHTARMKKLLESFMISYEKVPQETATVYVHIQKTNNLHPHITLVDFRGYLWQVPLDSTEFVIQKKASLLKHSIIKDMFEKNEARAKKSISYVFELLSDIAKKGVQDTDGALIRNDNVGLQDNGAILIDTGRLVLNEDMKTKACFEKDLKRMQPLRNWLQKFYPELVSHFDEEKERILHDF